MQKTLFYKNGTMKNQILNMLLYVGVFTPKTVALYDSPHSVYNAVSKMKKDGIIEKSNGSEVFENISYKNFKNEYEEIIEDNFFMEDIEWFMNYSREDIRYAKQSTKRTRNSEQSKNKRAKRIINNSEVAFLLSTAGVNVLPSEKAAALQHKTVEKSIYLSAREIKFNSDYKIIEDDEDEPENYSTIASRTNGLLISPGGNYNLYHLGKTKNSTDYFFAMGEAKIRNYENVFLAGFTLKGKTPFVENSILLVYRLEELKKYITPDRKTKQNWEALEINYPEIYALPYDRNGRDLLTVMLESDWKDFIYEVTMGELRADTGKLSVTCDYYINNEYVFDFCVPQLNRFIQFVRSVESNQNDSFRVVCFDFQADFVKSCFSQNAKVKIQTVKLADMMNVFNEEFKNNEGKL